MRMYKMEQKKIDNIKFDEEHLQNNKIRST